MYADPPLIKPKGQATLKWEDPGTYIPSSSDWIGHYCGSDLTQVADTHYLHFHYVTVDDGWGTGRGTETVTIYASAGSICEFRMFNYADGSSYHKIGTSNTFQVQRKPPTEKEVTMTIHPSSVVSGGSVTLSWESAGKYSPTSSDWIGYYCGDDLSLVADTAYFDWTHVTVDRDWASGSGSETVRLQSARLPHCEFRMFNSEDGSSYNKIGTSNTVEVSEFIARHLHLALTGDNTEMLVHWTAINQDGEVEFALSGSAWDSEAVSSVTGTCHTYTASDMCHGPATSTGSFVDPGQLCEAVLRGLTPDAHYQYRITTDGGKTYTEAAVFQAAPQVDPEYSFAYLVYGDMGTWGGDSSSATAKIAAAETTKGSRMTHHFGDLSYARGYSYLWDVWMPMIEPYAKVAPYMVVMGNHEFDYMSGYSPGHANDPSGEAEFKPSWGNFGNTWFSSGGECGVPTVNRFHMPSERSGGNSVFWHSYDFGSLHTVVLSSEHDCSDGSRQKAWLTQDLAKVDRTRTPWLVVELHRPMYNNENYSGDYNVAVAFQAAFEDVLVEYNVDLVLAGHYHSYLRSKRIYKDKADERGIYHFTIGSAGFSLDGASLWKKDWVEHYEEHWGFGRITVANSTAMHFEFIRNKENNGKGAVVDETWIVKKSVVV